MGPLRSVRGGQSVSRLHVTTTGNVVFSGHLDITSLGGAGFASQRTLESHWDLRGFDGLKIQTVPSSGPEMWYSLNIYTSARDNSEPGASSRVNWKFSFSAGEELVSPRWAEFKPNYRGKEVVVNPPSLDVVRITAWSIMCQSYFGEQHGDFHLEIVLVQAE
ncbi:hypothetical protein HKX48_004891 [Thoreauomyces humboldtii]|nr:hypothetical protein HKX48_004891 [Thoreauomyces humboldtii]